MTTAVAVVPAVERAEAALAGVSLTLEKATAELAGCVREVHSREAAYQQSEEARLSGTTNGAACGDLRAHLVDARTQRDVLSEVLQRLRQHRALAQAALTVAQDAARREAAMQAWNTLAAEQDTACRRIEKGLRELVSAMMKHRALALEQLPLAPAAGVSVLPWPLYERRHLTAYLLSRLVPLGMFERPHKGLVEELRLTERHLWELCPYTQPQGPDDPAPPE